jgi:anti-sigma-K factor RskA
MSTDDAPRGDRPDVRDLLGAYALDAVDDVEARTVERLVERDPDAARELAELRATAAVLDAITRVPQVGADPARRGAKVSDSTVTELTPSRRRRTTTWLAVAATAVGAAVIPSGLAIQQAQQAQRAEQQAEAVADLLTDPEAQVVRAEVAGGGTAVGVLAGDRALFTATGLAEPGSGLEYQLWVIRDGEALPRDVMPDDAGAVRAVTDGYRPGDALAVTVEPASGSQQPTSEPVVVLEPVRT